MSTGSDSNISDLISFQCKILTLMDLASDFVNMLSEVLYKSVSHNLHWSPDLRYQNQSDIKRPMN